MPTLQPITPVTPLPTQTPPPTPTRTPSPLPIQPAVGILVAIQGTGLNAMTDGAGRFVLDAVPANLFLTIGAGPAQTRNATVSAVRPNVVVGPGATVDLGDLFLNPPNGNGCQIGYAVYA